MQMNKLDRFEQRMKDALDGFEVPYNSADWAQLERAMAGTASRSRWSKGGLLALLFAGGLVTGGGAIWWLSTTDEPVAATQGGAANGPALTVPAAGASVTPPEAPASPAVTAALTAPASATSTSADPAAPAPAGSTSAAKVGTGTAMTGTVTRPIASPAPGPERNSSAGVVEARPEPAADDMAFRASAAEGCPGTAIQFAANGMPENAIYLWNFGDGSFSNQPRPDHTFTKSGKFEVMLSVTNSGGGSIQNKASSDLIVIHEAPEAAFEERSVAHAGHIPSMHFENRSIGGTSYHWEFGDGSNSSVAHPDHIFLKKGVYNVRLTVTNEKGCVDTREREVRVDRDYNLDAPGSFSPNADGNDDLFMPEALRTLGARFNLVIHHAASGRKVYETSDATRPWTGRMDNRGEVCEAGEYVWMATIHEGAHLGNVVFNGKVSLVR